MNVENHSQRSAVYSIPWLIQGDAAVQVSVTTENQ